MTVEKADLLQRFLRWARILIPLTGILLVVLQWWQNAQLMSEAVTANHAMREIWQNQPAEFPLDKLGDALYVPVAVSPLGAFDPGDGPWQAQSIWLQLTKVARGQDQLGYDVFSAGRQMGLSAALFTQIAIPCIALLLGWRQVRDNRSTTLQSWITLQTAVIEYSGPTVALGCFLTAALQRQTLGSEGAIRLMLILGMYVLYCLAAGTICWLVYHRVSSISRATGILVLFWVFNFTLARPMTINLVTSLYRLPTLDEYARRLNFEVNNGYNGVEPRNDRQRRFMNEILKDYKVDRPEDVPVNLSALVLQKEERHQREVASRLRGDLEAIYEKQEFLEQGLSVIFPMVAIQISSSALSATDFASQRTQLREADEFWDRVVNKVYSDVAISSGPQAEKIVRGADYWRQFPFFEARIPSPFWALLACGLPSLGLVLYVLAGGVSAFLPEKREGQPA